MEDKFNKARLMKDHILCRSIRIEEVDIVAIISS